MRWIPLTALSIVLALAGGSVSARAATPLGVSVSTTTPDGTVAGHADAAGVYDLTVSNGGPAVSVTIQGPGLARVVFLPAGAFRKLRNVGLAAGLYTVDVHAVGGRASTQLVLPVGVALTSVGAKVDGTTLSLLDVRTGVPSAAVAVPAGWVNLGISPTSAPAADVEGPGVVAELVVAAGNADGLRARLFLPGPGEYTVGVVGSASPPSKLVVADSAAPQAEAPALPADVLAPKAKIGKLACRYRGHLSRCGARRANRTLGLSATDAGPGATGVARVEAQFQAGTLCFTARGDRVSCGETRAWIRATRTKGRWSVKVPWLSFFYVGNPPGLIVKVRAFDRQGNEQPIRARVAFPA